MEIHYYDTEFFCVFPLGGYPKKVFQQPLYHYWDHEEVFRQEEEDQDRLLKFILPGAEQKKVLERLAMMNINVLSLFGSDESLMGWLAYDRIKKRLT